MYKEKSMEEVREEFLDHVRFMVDYWDNVEKDTTKEKLSGLAFSILVALDGCASDLPAFIVAPLPNKEDKQYLIENEEDYYSENHNSDVKCDIAGSLHELFYKK
jgi:hypothetical protein